MDKIVKSDAEWREELPPDAYRILRKHGTERAFSGDLWEEKRPGLYLCRGCDLPLFGSADKFDSGTGWPSFSRPLAPENIETTEDRSLFMRRTEVHCARCEGHLGHVFPDGPEPTGLRYCLNSAALKFQPESDT